MTMEWDRDLDCCTVRCDHAKCNEFRESDEQSFASAWEEFKQAGWRRFKDADGEWADRCPACVEDFRDSGAGDLDD